METMENESRLDGFAKPYLVGQKNPRSESRCNLSGNRDLMGNQIDPPASESPGGVLTQIAPALKAFDAHLESLEFIHLPSQEPFLGFRETDGVRKLRLGHRSAAALIG